VASISELDLSNCTKITDLHCGWLPFLTEIDLTCLPKLVKFLPHGSGFTELDTSQNPELETFQAFFTPNLTTVDVTQNPKLKWFYLDNTKVTSVDLSGNPVLAELRFESTKIESIDLSHNPELLTLYCAAAAIKSLDVSHNPKLIELALPSTAVSELDVSNTPNLQLLNCLTTKISSLDVTQCPEMRRLGLTRKDNNGNYVACDYLNISGCKYLTELAIATNATTSFNALQGDVLFLGLDTEVDGLVTAKIKTLIADNISVQNVYSEKNSALETLSLQNCRMARIDMLDNANLHKLYMYGTDAAGVPTTVSQSGNAADFEIVTTPRP
jgi:Leucine-rich repeat (LRR) protein